MNANQPEYEQNAASEKDKTILGVADERQDIPELRTPNSKSYPTSIPGQYKSVIYGSAVHYIGNDQKYYDINTSATDENSLAQVDKPVSSEIQEEFQTARSKRKDADKAKKSIPNEETSFYALQVPYKLVLPKNFSKGYTIGSGKDQLTFTPQNTQKSIGSIDNNDKSVIRYENAWPSTTVTLSILPDGVKEDIYLQDAKAPNQLEFEVKGALDQKLNSGPLRLLPAWLEDSNGNKRDVAMKTQKKGNKTFISLTWDGVGLSYPIHIDPTVGITYSNSYYYCTNGTTVNDGFLVSTDPNKQCESYLTFYTNNIPRNATILNAYVLVNVLMSYGNNYDIRARQVTTPVSQNSTTGRPKYSMNNQTTRIIANNPGSKGDQYSWDVSGMVADTYRNGITMIGLYPSNSTFGTVNGDFNTAKPSLSVYFNTSSIQYQYDANNRLASSRLSTGHLKSNSFDRNGNLLRSSLQYNLLENGDFNLGGMNWNLGDQMQISQTISKDTFSLGFSSSTATAQASTTSSYPIAVKFRDQYTLSGYLMDNTASGNIYITWKEYHYYFGLIRTGSKLLSSSKGTNTWEFKSISFSPSSMTSWMTVDIVADPGTKGSAYFDGIKISPGVRNADFELGQSNWTNGGIMKIQSSGDSHSNIDNGYGNYTIVFSSPQAGTASVNTETDIPVEPLKNYVYGSWFKNVNLSGKTYVRLDEYSASNQLVKSTKLDANSSAGSDWVYKEIGFQTSKDTRFLRIVVQVENGTGTTLVDDMQLVYKG
ncbi:hypothetical protein PCCS19_18630 [Paenibacillus sp. CCS19]|uniref:hypothetical protein n=1 Tax=Paenibacillus sp. CCS19 TaxID=3158387 RepID=UPI00256573BC|nr:hypothetical protein [Paenibacillus cellulosilyticus]GMK38809.1 hypothetical protein PCCS19_18630 [Paenibacillus cellulosilyticus]